MVCYVYDIEFPSGKHYIGISVNPEKRWKNHCYNATTTKNTPLIAAIRSYGKHSAKRKILLAGTVEYAKMMEQKIISRFNTIYPNGYNISPGGDYSPCVIPEIAEKVAAKLRGRKASLESKAKMSAAHLGKPKSLTHRENIGKSKKGLKLSEYRRVQCSLARKGKKMPDSAKAAISKYQKEHNAMNNPESRKKISQALLGRPLSEAHKQKLKDAWVRRRAS